LFIRWLAENDLIKTEYVVIAGDPQTRPFFHFAPECLARNVAWEYSREYTNGKEPQ